MEGLLVCSNDQCLSEYPIIDGIPIIVPDLRDYVSQNILPILSREDLTDTMESLLEDCCGSGSAFDSFRQHLSTYSFEHYGDLDPDEGENPFSQPGSVLSLLKRGRSLIQEKVGGPVIDVGCAVGRTSFELAGAFDGIVLGVDLNFAMLKTAAGILNDGIVTYPKRRVGMVFDRHAFSTTFEKADQVDFWACDATCLPFCDQRFSMAASINLLDCVQSPHEHLKELARILKPEAQAFISTPYDWNINATPVESWLGGHSQRSESRGASEIILRSLLAGGGHPDAVADLVPISEVEAVPWHLRLHDRSYMNYLVHLVAVRKKAIPVTVAGGLDSK